MHVIWQIQSLLNDRRVSEALELARGVHKTGLSKEKFTAVSTDLCMLSCFTHSHLVFLAIWIQQDFKFESGIYAVFQKKKLFLFSSVTLRRINLNENFRQYSWGIVYKYLKRQWIHKFFVCCSSVVCNIRKLHKTVQVCWHCAVSCLLGITKNLFGFSF